MECAGTPADAGALLGRGQPDVVLRAHLLEAPFGAFPAAQQRAEVNQQRNQGTGFEAGEPFVDRRLAGAVDAHDPGDEKGNGQQPPPPAANNSPKGERE